MQSLGNLVKPAPPEVAANERSIDDHKAKRGARLVIELVLTVDISATANDPCPLSGQLDLRLSRFDF